MLWKEVMEWNVTLRSSTAVLWTWLLVIFYANILCYNTINLFNVLSIHLCHVIPVWFVAIKSCLRNGNRDLELLFLWGGRRGEKMFSMTKNSYLALSSLRVGGGGGWWGGRGSGDRDTLPSSPPNISRRPSYTIYILIHSCTNSFNNFF